MTTNPQAAAQERPLPELLSCPFCGQAGEYRNVQDWHGVGCQTSKCPGIRSALYHRSRDAAFAAWNRRAAVSSASAMEEDAARYRYLRDRLIGADFDWNESGTCVIVFEWPKDVRIGVDCSANIDAARALLSQAKERNMDRG